jgi:hypothetical protein
MVVTPSVFAIAMKRGDSVIRKLFPFSSSEAMRYANVIMDAGRTP